MVARGIMNAAFTALSATDAGDEEVVNGVLAALLDQQPKSIRQGGYGKLIYENGFCFRAALVALQPRDLVALGVKPGHAGMVCRAINPEGPVAVVEVTEERMQVASDSNGGRRVVPEFPALQKNGLPSARDLRGHMPLVYAVLRSRKVATQDLKAALAAPGAEIDPDYGHGVGADKALWDVLIEKGLPAQIMLSFPPAVREGEQGLRAWTHLFRRVVAVTDQSVGALQAYLDSPPVVTRKGMFGQAIVDLLNVFDQLGDAGCV